MRQMPSLSKKEKTLAFDVLRGLSDALTFSELHEAVDTAGLATLFEAKHVAVCMASPEGPERLEWKTQTLEPLLRDYERWRLSDFVGRYVLMEPNKAFSDIQMLQGRVLKDEETYRRSREHGLDLKHVLSVFVVPDKGGRHGGVTLYREDPRSFSEKSRRLLDWLTPMVASAFQRITRFSALTGHTQLLDALSRQQSAALVLNSHSREVMRTSSATQMLERWFSPSQLASGVPREWLSRLAELVKLDGAIRPGLSTCAYEAEGRELKMTFLRLPRAAGHQLWELRMDERVLLPEAWRLLLTEQQTTVANYLLHGWEDKEIATELGCALGTVKKHTQHIYKRVGADGRSDFISRALRH